MSVLNDKSTALIEYLNQCESIRDSALYFNFANIADNNKQFVTVSNDVAIERPYVDGSVMKRYTFTIIDYKTVNYMPIVAETGYTDENLEDFVDASELIDWITEQNEAHNYPDFGETCQVDSIRATSEIPNLNGVDTSIQPPLAKYSITIIVEYLDKSKMIWN